jgi:hypothetical protein
VARPPDALEVSLLERLFEQQAAVYGANGEAAKAVAGKFTPPPGTTPGDFAAWHAVATALLNLDEMITKG